MSKYSRGGKVVNSDADHASAVKSSRGASASAPGPALRERDGHVIAAQENATSVPLR